MAHMASVRPSPSVGRSRGVSVLTGSDDSFRPVEHRSLQLVAGLTKPRNQLGVAPSMLEEIHSSMGGNRKLGITGWIFSFREVQPAPKFRQT